DASTTSHPPLIALDLDDVLCQTNVSIAKWHNATFDTYMTLDDFHYYHYWKNPYWGSPEETLKKVQQFLKSPEFLNVPVVEGAKEGVAELRRLGFRLVIVTARASRDSKLTDEWLSAHLPGSIDAVYYTGEFVKKDDSADAVRPMTKAEVLRDIGAVLFVDDSLNNAASCASAQNAPPVLLFGNYEWSKRYSKYDPVDERAKMSFEERCRIDGNHFWEKEVVDDASLPPQLTRVSSWPEVI
ncbi:uncharacterized protein EI90DRAFT_2884894, partial [Cantharellus anzutake]|uniref:uncharacterized protein n=1 Tax=Cantharellus anzutake TaxID=1750568 RepID=UPI0019053317